MSEWVEVVTQPLGLVGFGLFLVFGYLGKVKRQDERRGLSRIAFTLAALALIGGLGIAYVQIPRPKRPNDTEQPKPPHKVKVQQNSTGPGSPNVQGVSGDVTITVDQSSGKTTADPKKQDQGNSK
jgi:hypothetical protein